MSIVSAVATTAATLALGLFVFTRLYSLWIEYKHPPIGLFANVGDVNLHYVDVPAGTKADLPAMIFIHGASSNLQDQKLAFEQTFKGRGRMIFVDRPGHGYSDQGNNDYHQPAQQADAIARLLKQLNISKAIIVGHSFGGSVSAAFAVHHPEMVKGLVFLAPATHPWPGGVAWYYQLAAKPVTGYLFTEVLALPAGILSLKGGINSVFAPNDVPANYAEKTASELVFRPKNFRNNARQVVALKKNVRRLSPRYKEIVVPTVIITGDSDDIVIADIHSKGLQKDIRNARLVELKNIGHKPDYLAIDEVKKAIEFVSR